MRAINLFVNNLDLRLARRFLALGFALVVVPTFVVFGQGSGRGSTGTGGDHVISGKIYFPSGRRAEGQIQIKLESFQSGEITTMADASGAFSFGQLSPGNYTVEVNAGDNYEVARENVTIDSDLNLSRSGVVINQGSRRYTVMVTLQPKRAQANQTTPGVINAALAEVPEAARNLYEQALELAKAGNSQQAIVNLKTAISLYPNFPLALNELGVEYLKSGDPRKAIDPLRSAVKLSPDAFTPKLNLGISLLEVQQYADAELQLRDALKISATPTAHMYLGLTLARLKNDSEAETELKAAIQSGGNQLPIAHYYLGGLYWQMRQYREAADELDIYLRLSPNAPDAERVRSTIKQLRAKS